jgi:hypothetical protein
LEASIVQDLAEADDELGRIDAAVVALTRGGLAWRTTATLLTPGAD